MAFVAPYPPYDPTDKSGFSYETVVKRWPIILTSIVDQLHRENHALQAPEKASEGNNAKVAEGKNIIERVSRLKYQMARDHALEPIQDEEPYVELYNNELERLAQESRNTWFTAPWLYAECYLYRFLRSFFAQTQHWRDYDPFFAQKVDVFQKSGPSIYRIASSIHDIEVAKDSLKSEPSGIAALFQEMIQMCLCASLCKGQCYSSVNRHIRGFLTLTCGFFQDLSLLTHMSLSDIEKLQTVEKEAQSARKEFILKDDQEQVWDHVKALKDGRVDFILDNAGFEVFTDLVFADFLVTYTPYASKVVFHGKLIPWFVSDVTPPDFKYTIESLLDQSYFASSASATPEEKSQLQELAARISRYVEQGVFVFSVPVQTPLGGNGQDSKLGEFWTNPLPYWNMERECVDLWRDLRNSDLVIFKGDLNYRKLTGDIKWPSTTTFKDAIGKYFLGSKRLRTNKADVAVGLTQETLDDIEKKDEKWRVNGKYALISFLPQTK
ncbi:Hairy/enhancer-of-split with YRPW motif protein 2 [Marasmius crinis-equi]|uniref:Sugar phosphate phosphatase n=1 Tax=Marasmius crinis-equi TaxID=585013 RepID=A0ABR3FJA3_9AGAR